MGGAVPGPTWGAAATTTHSLSRPPRPPSLSSPPFALTALRKVSGSPRRLLAQGVQSPGPSGRGVGEGSLSGRRSATANFGCARLGTRGACVGGVPRNRGPNAPQPKPQGRGDSAPARTPRTGRGGWGGPGRKSRRGPRARPHCRPGEHLPHLPQGRGPTSSAAAAEGTPAPAAPSPHHPPPTLAWVRAGGWRHCHRRAERARPDPRSAAAAASPPSSSSSSAGLAGSRQISSPSRPARPSRSPPGWARPATGSGAEPAGAGLRRSLRQARGEPGAAAGTARCEPGAGRAGGAAAASAPAPAPDRARARYRRPRQRRDCSTFFLSVIEGFL